VNAVETILMSLNILLCQVQNGHKPR